MNSFIIVHTPEDGRELVLAVEKIESIIEAKPHMYLVREKSDRGRSYPERWVKAAEAERMPSAFLRSEDGKGELFGTRSATQIRMDSGDYGMCQESVQDVLDLIGLLANQVETAGSAEAGPSRNIIDEARKAGLQRGDSFSFADDGMLHPTAREIVDGMENEDG